MAQGGPEGKKKAGTLSIRLSHHRLSTEIWSTLCGRRGRAPLPFQACRGIEAPRVQL